MVKYILIILNFSQAYSCQINVRFSSGFLKNNKIKQRHEKAYYSQRIFFPNYFIYQLGLFLVEDFLRWLWPFIDKVKLVAHYTVRHCLEQWEMGSFFQYGHAVDFPLTWNTYSTSQSTLIVYLPSPLGGLTAKHFLLELSAKSVPDTPLIGQQKKQSYPVNHISLSVDLSNGFSIFLI